jgi:hypothetical protein
MLPEAPAILTEVLEEVVVKVMAFPQIRHPQLMVVSAAVVRRGLVVVVVVAIAEEAEVGG